MTDVSIIIPTFNRARFLGDAIESAMGQGEGTEVIVVDDGSTDGTAALLERFGARIRVLRQENLGPSAARNLAAGVATGNHLFFADSDDLIEPNAVQKLLEQARTLGPAIIPFGRATTIDEAGRPCAGVSYGFGDAESGTALNLPALLSGTMPLWLALIPAATYRMLGGLRSDLKFGEDQEFALRAHAAGIRYVATAVPTIRVRLHEAPRLSGSANQEFGARAVKLWSLISEQVAGLPDFDDRSRNALARVIWIAGRGAARARAQEPAERLFALAKSLAGDVERSEPLPLRLLSRGIGPYRTERTAEVVKRIIGRS